MPRRSRKNGESGRNRWSIFKPWLAIPSTTFPACRWWDQRSRKNGSESSARSIICLPTADELPKGKAQREFAGDARSNCPSARRLVRLHSEVPISINWDHAQSRAFRSGRRGGVLRRVRLPHTHQPNARSGQRPTAPAFTHRYETIATPERLQWLVDEMSKQKQISLDTETTSIYPCWAEIVGYSFAWNEGEAYYRAGARAGRRAVS